MKTLTVKSPLSVPYLFFTRMLYLPESEMFTPVMVKLANLPDSNFKMQCSSDVIDLFVILQPGDHWYRVSRNITGQIEGLRKTKGTFVSKACITKKRVGVF